MSKSTKSSRHQQEEQEQEQEQPPPYSSTTTTTTIPTPTPGLPNLDYTKCAIPDATTTTTHNGTEIITRNTTLNSDPGALARFIRDQASLPPVPFVRVAGVDQCGIVEFEVWVNMLRYFLPRSWGQGGGWNYVTIAREDERGGTGSRMNPNNRPPSLEEWARRYCAEKTAAKTFTLTRRTPNWNTSLLEGQIRSLVASTGYSGKVTVTFPVHNARVSVQPRRSGIEGVFWSFFAPLIMEKRSFEVISAVWPYASLLAGAEGRVCAVLSEERWLEEWKGVVKMGVLQRKKGLVSVDDLLAAKMGIGHLR